MEYKKGSDRLSIKYFLLIMILILLSAQIMAIDDKSEKNVKLEDNSKILKEFNNVNEIPVVVRLKDSSDIKVQGLKVEKIEKLKQRDEWFKPKINQVLKSIPETEIRDINFEMNGFSAYITENAFNKLINDPNVEEIIKELDRDISVNLDKSVELINVKNDLWNSGYNGEDTEVCIIDSGIDTSNSEISSKISDKYCFCSTPDGNNLNCCYGNKAASGNATDILGHGTHVAGIISSQNSKYKGAAYGANISMVKVLNSTGSGRNPEFSRDLRQAIRWCIFNRSADVISMSLGDRGNYSGIFPDLCPTNVNDEINMAYEAGITVIASAGNNELITGIGYPACAPNVISVGSSTKSDYMSVFFTNRYSGLDLVAPGGTRTGKKEPCPLDDWICSTKLNGGFIGKSGTSMSAPHVSGAAAILKQFGKEELNRDLSPSEILNALNFTGVPITDTGFSELTFQRIDVAAAISYLSKINVDKSVKGKIRQNQTWQTNLSIINAYSIIIGHPKTLDARLTWNTANDLDFILIDPNGTKYYAIENNQRETLQVSAIDGTWTIQVKGKNVNGSVDFKINAVYVLPNPTEVGSGSGGGVGGINLTSLNLNYISTCNPNEVSFIMKGTEAEEDDTLINITNATVNAVDYFLTGLVIPNDRLWITMDAVPGDGPFGYVGSTDRVDANLKQTRLGQTLLDADVKLKFDQFGQDAEFNERIMLQDWINDVQSSPYWSELQSKNFNSYPTGLRRTWIQPSKLEAESDGCNVYLTNVTLNVSYVWDNINLDLSKYSLSQSAVNDLNTRLNNWKQRHLQSQYNNVTNTTIYEINNDPKYHELRSAAAALAIAQWYKEQDRSQVPFGDIIDSNDIIGNGLNISFDANYWNGQAWQYLYRLNNSPSFLGGDYWWDWYGGVTLRTVAPNITGALNNSTTEIIENVTTQAYVQENETIHFRVVKNPNKADLIPAVLGFSLLKTKVNETINITVIVDNVGEVDSDSFEVYFRYSYKYPNGFTTEKNIAHIYVSNIEPNSTRYISTLEKFDNIGTHTIIAEIDSNNTVEEFNEINNLISLDIEIKDILPTSDIQSPVTGTQYFFNQTITFLGIGKDYEDRILNESLYNWTSNRDGYLGNGEILEKTNITLGDHVISLTVEDSDENKDTDQILISITPSLAPIVNITSPSDGEIFIEGETIYFEGEAVDNEDGDLTGDSLLWNSSLTNSQIGTGELLTKNTLNPGTHNITLTAIDSGGTQTIDQITITIEESTPNITINQPENNIEFTYINNNITFNATSTDAHQGDLSPVINWTSSIDGSIGDGSYFSKLLSQGTHLISAFVRDNFGLTNLAQIYLTILQPQNPTDSIITPRNNQNFTNGDLIIFRGLGNDPETGSLSGDNLIWVSNLNGNIGNGTLFNTSSLSLGTHEITLTGTDPDSQTTQTKLNITIVSASPVVTIHSPTSGNAYSEGNEILFNATVTDLEDGNLIGDSLEWGSNLDGELGTGTNLTLTTLSKGIHQIILNATDSDGISTLVTNTISIVGLGSNSLNTFSDGTSVKSLNYSSAGDQVVYVRIPKGANITSATLTIEGLPYEE